MIEKAFVGSKRYFGWIFLLLIVIGFGMGAYVYQFMTGLGITGMGRDVSWGIYIAQFTFFVGVAASAVMVVLPYYLHNYKAYGKITILGEFLAIGSVIMCQLFIFVDLGQPTRILNVMLHPALNSVMFYDMIVLCGYLGLNAVIGWNMLTCEKKGTPPPSWVKFLVYVSIPWAVSIHTVTAFLYSGLPGRHLWMTAVLAPRFLASAFAAGPALLIILCLVVRHFTNFDPGKKPLQTLAKTVTYAMLMNVFFVLLEFFTAFYSNIPGHMHPLEYLFFGSHGHYEMVPLMWTAALMAVVGIVMLLVPKIRQNERNLVIACVLIFGACWIDKGLGFIIGGFNPNAFGHVTTYVPSIFEILITVGVYGIGALIVTVLYKIVVSVKEEIAI